MGIILSQFKGCQTMTEKTYKIVPKYMVNQDCEKCLFGYWEDHDNRVYCNSPNELGCEDDHIWVLEEIKDND